MKKYVVLSVLTVFTLLFVAFAQKSSADDDGWQNVGSCVSTGQCGSTQGVQNQSRVVTTRECESGCPEYTFTTNRDIPGYYSCEEGYELYVSQSGEHKCKKWIPDQYETRYADRYWLGSWHCPNHDWSYTSTDSSKYCSRSIKIEDGYWDRKSAVWHPATVENYSKTFTYQKSQDPNHCHKPTPDTLNIPTWARGAYGSNVPELGNFIEINCHNVSNTETRTIECQLEQPTPACEDPRTHVCLDIEAINYDSDFDSETEVEDQDVCDYDGGETDPTPTPEPTATPNNGDVCANLDGIQTSLPDDSYHFDPTGKNCLQFSVPGVEQPTGGANVSQPQVLGASTTNSGKVLGASTMAGTGAVEDAFFNSMFALGSLLTSFGIMKNGKKRA